jgi:ABC-2 type transport system permease protein
VKTATAPLRPLAGWRVLAPAFVRRDWRIARSYRLQFLLDLAVLPLTLALFFFLSELVDPSRLPADADLSKGYFSYAAVGLVMLRMVQTALTSFTTKLRTEQVSGTFETLLASPVSPSAVVLGSAAFELLRALFGGAAMLLVASLFGVRLEVGTGSLISLVLGLPALLMTFASVGVLVAAFAVVVKQVTALIGMVTAALGLLAGAYFPIDLLPGALRTVANLLPFTWGVDVLRAALLRGELASGRLAALVGFAVVSLPVSLWVFRLSVDRARLGGTLTQF